MRDYHIILNVTNGGEQLNHKPIVQYRRVLEEHPMDSIRRVTLTMPRIDAEGAFHPAAPITMNLLAFRRGRGFSNSDIRRWLEGEGWAETGTLLLYKVTFRRGRLDYKLVGKVD
jgi:hypothetical protein